MEIRTPVLSQEPLEDRAELGFQHFPLLPPPNSAPAPPTRSDSGLPDMDSSSLLQAAPPDMAPIRITRAALTKQFMPLSAIDSAALGETAPPHRRQR